MMARAALHVWLWLTLCGLLLVTGAAAQERSAGEIDLRPKFEKGQEIRYRMELSNSTRNEPAGKAGSPGKGQQPARRQPGRPGEEERQEIIEFGAMPERSQSSVAMDLTMRVLEVSPDKVATVDMVFDSMKLRTTVGEEVFEFDSTAPVRPGEQDPIAMLLTPMVGMKVTLTVDRNGNITRVSGGEPLAKFGQIVGGAPGGGQGGAAQLFGPIFSAHPTKGVAKIGESWEHSDRVPTGLMGEFKMTTRHTLRGLQGRDAQVAISGRIEPVSEEPGGSTFQLQNSSYGGSYVWDTVKGQLSKMDTSMNVRITGKVGAQPLDSRNESTVKITRVDRSGRP